MKTPSAVSEQWGSYFVDVPKSAAGEDEGLKLTWCSHSIHTYSHVAIPSVEAIAGTVLGPQDAHTPLGLAPPSHSGSNSSVGELSAKMLTTSK